MSFCRFETVKTDNSDTCRFYISREVSAVFQKNNYKKTHPANQITCRVKFINESVIIYA